MNEHQERYTRERARLIRKLSGQPPLVGGGQGRAPVQVRSSAVAVAISMWLFALVVACVVVAQCAGGSS